MRSYSANPEFKIIENKCSSPIYDDKIIDGEESPINFVGLNEMTINIPQSDFIHIHLRFKVKSFDSTGYHEILSIIPYNILLYDQEHGGNRLDVYYYKYNWYRSLYGPTILLNAWYFLDYIIDNNIFTVYLNGSKIGSFSNSSGVNAGNQISIINGRRRSSTQTLVDDIFISTTPLISGDYVDDTSKFFMWDYTLPFEMYEDNRNLYKNK